MSLSMNATLSALPLLLVSLIKSYKNLINSSFWLNPHRRDLPFPRSQHKGGNQGIPEEGSIPDLPMPSTMNF